MISFLDEILHLGGQGDVGQIQAHVLVVVGVVLVGPEWIEMLHVEFFVEFEPVHFLTVNYNQNSDHRFILILEEACMPRYSLS